MKIFKKENIFLSLNLQSKDEIFDFIAKKAHEMNITKNPEKIKEGLIKREKEFSTGFENHFAIPHTQSDYVDKPTLFFLKLNNENIEWETIDGKNIKYVFAILIPSENKETTHLETLSKISSLLMNEEEVKKMIASNNEEEIEQIVNNYLSNSNKENSENKKSKGKKVVAVTACLVGVAHTYLAAEKLEKAFKEKGYYYKVETRGSVGPKNIINSSEVEEAEFVIIASDIELDMSKFVGKKVYRTSTKDAIKNSQEVVKQAEEKATLFTEKDSRNSNKEKDSSQGKTGIIKHILSGVSYMIPFVIFGGILIALSLGIGKIIYGSNSAAPKGDFLWWILEIGVVSFKVMIGILGAYIAYSIAGRAAIMPALVVSLIANDNSLFYNIGGIEVKTPMGFMGAIMFGLLIGYTVKWMSTWNIPKSLTAIMPIFIIPLGVTLFYALLVIFIIGAPIGWVMDKFINWLKGVFSTEGGLGIGISILMGALIGAMAGFDMGGPINKIAFLTCTALISSQIYEPMGMMAAAIPVAPLGMGLATQIFRKKFNNEEKSLGISALIMGTIGISEGAIPFAVADPKKAIISNVIGSAVAGALAGAFSITNAAAHGGPIVAILGAVSAPGGIGVGILLFFVAIIVGTLTTGLIYGFWRNVDDNSMINANTRKKFILFKKGEKNEK